MKKENVYTYHIQTVQNLLPCDNELELYFCGWVRENQNIVNCILFTNESIYIRNRKKYLKNSYRWSRKNPNVINESNSTPVFVNGMV